MPAPTFKIHWGLKFNPRFIKRYLNFDIRTIYTGILQKCVVSSTETILSFHSMSTGGKIVVLLWSVRRSGFFTMFALCTLS